MSTYTVAEAKNKLSELIHRAVEGEEVIITRHGQPIVELKSVQRSRKCMTQADFEWLEAHRARLTPVEGDAGVLLREMRDEEWER